MQKLLNAQEVADLLGVKKCTIYQWTHQDFIPHVKLGRFVRFNENDIKKWLENKSCQGRNSRNLDISNIISFKTDP